MKVHSLDIFVSWLFLIIAIIGSFIISIVLTPILILMQGILLYIVLFLAGLFFGMIIHSIKIHLRKLKTSIMPWFFIPAIALMHVYLITLFSNNLIKILKVPTPTHSPLVISIIYTLAFLLPLFLRKSSHHVFKRESLILRK